MMESVIVKTDFFAASTRDFLGQLWEVKGDFAKAKAARERFPDSMICSNYMVGRVCATTPYLQLMGGKVSKSPRNEGIEARRSRSLFEMQVCVVLQCEMSKRGSEN